MAYPPLVPPPDTPTILFSASYKEGQITLDPIAIVRADSLEAPPVGEIGDSAADAFRATYFSGDLYWLLQRGTAIDAVQALKASTEGCSMLTGIARLLAPFDSTQLRKGAIATNARRLARLNFARPVSGADSAWLRARATQLLADSGLAAYGSQLRPDAEFAFTTDAGRQHGIAGTFRAGNATDSLVSVLVLGQDSGSGPVLAYEELRSGAGETSSSLSLFDLVDIDGDGTPEVVVWDAGSDGFGFEVLKRDALAWRRWYAGVSGGC